MSAPEGTTATVEYRTSDGTGASGAHAGVNYVGTNGTFIHFNPGQVDQTILIPMIHDGVVTGTLTGNVTLFNVSNATLDPNNSTGTFQIGNTDGPPPTLQLSSSTYTVNANAGSATITATMRYPWPVNVTVQYDTGGGTAIPNTDYTHVTGTLTFNPWDTAKTFNIPILDDGYPGNNLTLGIGLFNPTVATLGNPQAAMLTIVDDSPLPTVSLSPNPTFLFPGDTVIVTAAVSPFADAQYLTYISRDSSIATVSGSAADAT